MQIICTSLQTDNHASTSPLSFYRPDALPAAQPTASKHWRQISVDETTLLTTIQITAKKFMTEVTLLKGCQSPGFCRYHPRISLTCPVSWINMKLSQNSVYMYQSSPDFNKSLHQTCTGRSQNVRWNLAHWRHLANMIVCLSRLITVVRLLLPAHDSGRVYLSTSSVPRHSQHFVRKWKLIYFDNHIQTLLCHSGPWSFFYLGHKLLM